ncbi:MAG: PadR family transcriptional regulator [Candidatus Bathyarchaeota archaeon]|nr:PadR family transcriptional regulator [Candidatus Bathyarchaeota archaeon]
MHLEHEDEIATKWLKEVQKGYTRIALLILLSKRPYHGYEMMKEVEDRTEGFWKPTPGGVYPILQSLEELGYIKGEWGKEKRKRKSYNITETGKLILDRSLIKHGQITESLNLLFKEYAEYVLAVEPNTASMPVMKNPFSLFLDAPNQSRQKLLETKHKRLEHMLKMLQTELHTIEGKLAKLNKQKLENGSEVEVEEELED